jgi:hypothetical protein
MQIDDASNGLRLQSEMSRIYEGYTGMTGVVRSGAGDLSSPGTADMGYGGSAHGLGLSGGGDGFARQWSGSVYEHMKDMF